MSVVRLRYSLVSPGHRVGSPLFSLLYTVFPRKVLHQIAKLPAVSLDLRR